MASKRTTTKKTLSLYWHHMWRYPRYVIGVGLAIPFSVLVEQYLPPIVLANVLNRLAKGDYRGHNVWGSFGPELIAYAIFLLLGTIGWRVVDAFNWRLEAGVERDIAQRLQQCA